MAYVGVQAYVMAKVLEMVMGTVRKLQFLYLIVRSGVKYALSNMMTVSRQKPLAPKAGNLK